MKEQIHFKKIDRARTFGPQRNPPTVMNIIADGERYWHRAIFSFHAKMVDAIYQNLNRSTCYFVKKAVDVPYGYWRIHSDVLAVFIKLARDNGFTSIITPEDRPRSTPIATPVGPLGAGIAPIGGPVTIESLFRRHQEQPPRQPAAPPEDKKEEISDEERAARRREILGRSRRNIKKSGDDD